MDEVTREAPGHTEEGLDREALIHDLRIHQVELELQNDELRNAYARLEETGREYTDLFERAPLGLVVVDRHGMIVHEPLAGRPLADLVTTESALTWRGRFRAFFANPAEKRVDLELQTRNSTRRVIRLVGRTMKTLPAGGPPVAKNVGDFATAPRTIFSRSRVCSPSRRATHGIPPSPRHSQPHRTGSARCCWSTRF